MSDIAENLLVQYYGFSKEFFQGKTGQLLSIHECTKSAENNVEKLIDEQSTIDTVDDDDISKETEAQGNNVESEKRNSEDDIPVRSSRALTWEALKDDSETTTEFDITFEANASGNLYEDTNIFSNEETHNLVVHSCKTIPASLANPEENEGNDSYLSLGEDILPDSASDISSTADKKKLEKSVNTSALPSTNKIPIYNETFIDLTSTGLTSLPIEAIKQYPRTQMLYLENNSLTELPEELFISLQHLQWLDVRNNQLTSLPVSIKSHPSLETILLQGNKIEKLPLELCLVPKLKILNVAHNPIISPPKDIIILGCFSILSYLRAEWNKLHPEESATFSEQKIEPKPSTILCYQIPREKQRKISRIPWRISKSTNDIDSSFKGTLVRKKSTAYKPSNRCDSKGTNIAMEQQLHWISKARDLLSAQSATIQRIKDAETVKRWRRNKKSFSKSMEKVSKRNGDDIPFAIDIEDYPAIRKRSQKMEKYLDNRKQETMKFTQQADINKKIQELVASLQEFKVIKSPDILTPKTKQRHLQDEIEKISHFRKEVQNLRRYNEVILTSTNSSNNSS